MLAITVIYYPLHIKGLIHGLLQDENMITIFQAQGDEERNCFGF